MPLQLLKGRARGRGLQQRGLGFGTSTHTEVTGQTWLVDSPSGDFEEGCNQPQGKAGLLVPLLLGQVSGTREGAPQGPVDPFSFPPRQLTPQGWLRSPRLFREIQLGPQDPGSRSQLTCREHSGPVGSWGSCDKATW